MGLGYYLAGHGGSGFKGLELGEIGVRVGEGIGFGKGRKIEQLLAFRNSPKPFEASSDCRMAVSLHGLGKCVRLSLA